MYGKRKNTKKRRKIKFSAHAAEMKMETQNGFLKIGRIELFKCTENGKIHKKHRKIKFSAHAAKIKMETQNVFLKIGRRMT